jgi:hypothetical protein
MVIGAPYPLLFRPKRVVTTFVCVIAGLTSCHSHPKTVAVPTPVITPVIVRVEAPVPSQFPIPASLPDYVSPPVPGALEREQAERAFAAGNYDEAIRGYENFLLVSATAQQRDEALFRLGLCYLLRNNGSSDWQRGKSTLQQLINDYPDSSLKRPAAVILSLRSQVDELAGNIKAREQSMRQLSLELERLKRIDADRGRPF